MPITGRPDAAVLGPAAVDEAVDVLAAKPALAAQRLDRDDALFLGHGQ
jgi:hypothetical protein